MLSQGVLDLMTDLEKLLGHEFMTLEPVKGKKFEVPPGTRLIWDTQLLENVVKLLEPYEDFIRNGLRNFPPGLQNAIRNVAQNNLEGQVLDLIGRAQHFKHVSDRFSGRPQETSIRSEVKNFKEAAKLLDRLLVTFDQLDLVAPYLDLSELTDWQASTMLEAVDELLMTEGIYRPKGGDLSWWSGEEPISLAAFDLGSEDELHYYLNLQRERIKQMAYVYVEPIVTFYMDRPTPQDAHFAQILSKWENIILELDKYERKQPGNSIIALEKFILFEMSAINQDNYLEKIPQKDLSDRSGDFFLQIRNDLRRMLFDQCRSLAAKNVVLEYMEIGDFFNQKLAGKFPFSGIGEGEIVYEANPEDIRDFYRLFDRDAKDISMVLEGQGPGVSQRDAGGPLVLCPPA
jgi:type VI secretion system protein ImpL